MLRGITWESIAENLATVRRLRSPLLTLVDALEPVLARVHREVQLGLPMLPRAEFPIDIEAGVRLFRDLIAVAAGGPEEARAATIRLRKRAEDAKWVEGVLLAYASGDLEAAASQSEAASAQQPVFFAGMALRFGLEAAATFVSRWVSPAWGEAICPVCGTRPHAAELRAPEDRRHPHCGFCGFAWQYATTGCPACRNQNANTLRLLYVEEDRRSRLDLCEACRTYIKRVDNKEHFGIVPLVEDLLSPHLDVLALEKGFRPIGC